MALLEYFGKSGTLPFKITTNAAQVVVLFYGRNDPELVYDRFSYPDRGSDWNVLEKGGTEFTGILHEEATADVADDELMILVKAWNADGSQNVIRRGRILPLVNHPGSDIEFVE